MKHLDNELTKFLCSPCFPTVFPRMQKSVSKKISKRVYPISQQVRRQPAAKRLFRGKKKSRAKVQRQNSWTVFKNYLCWDGPVCSSTSFFLQQQQNPTIVKKQELPKHIPEKTPTYRKDTLKKEIHQQLSTSASLLINKILESPWIKPSSSNTLILDGIETVVLLEDFEERLNHTNVTVSDLYFTSVDAASIPPELVIDRHAKSKVRVAWIPFQIWTTKVAETLHARSSSLWFCAQFGKSSGTLSVKGQRVFTFKGFINHGLTSST